MNKVQLTAVIEREGGGYVSLCPGLDIASQGDTVGEASGNLKEHASKDEINSRMHNEIFVTRLEVTVG
ncbi:MAG: hypothetical protein L0Y35_00150 [Flammeovirgaceae bacterium]|nr:hypothetical protein [Flammeovirgaceae bacterium]